MARPRPSPASLGQVLAWRAGQSGGGGGGGDGDGGSCPEDGIWNLSPTGSGTHSRLSGKTVTKCHDFHSSWRSAEFGDSQHEFLSFSGSSKATTTCLSTAPPSAEALRVRSVRTSGHNLVWRGMRYEGLKLEGGQRKRRGRWVAKQRQI